MKPSVTAVVVSHDEPTYLRQTLEAVSRQTHRPDHLFVVDSSQNNQQSVLEVIEQFPAATGIRAPGDSSLQQSVNLALAQLQPGLNDEQNLDGKSQQWLWLLHDDSAPEPNVLELLLAKVEVSTTVAVAAPKLLRWESPKIIQQLGLTLTRSGELFNRVSGEIDQSQHDQDEDVLAVGTAAALYSLTVFQKLEGFDDSAPQLAQDYDFSIRARLSGYRVVVVPDAKVRHAALSLAGQRPKSWLGASPRLASRKANFYLRMTYGSAPQALLTWLLMPLLTLIRSINLLRNNRPNLIGAEFAAGSWAFFTLPARLKQRKRVRSRVTGRLAQLSALFATPQQVRAARRSEYELEQSRQQLVEFERGLHESPENTNPKGFFAAGGGWLATMLLIASFAIFPIQPAVIGGGYLPLSDSWLEIFNRAGSSWQPLGFGTAAPSDPFVWVLVFIGGLTFWQPSLALTVLLFIAKPLAYLGVWRLLGAFTRKNSVRTLVALGYVLWPGFTEAQYFGTPQALVVLIALPWFLLALVRIQDAGIRSIRSSQQTWSWVAVAALLMAAIAASSPSFGFAALAIWLLAVLLRLKRAGYLLWVPVGYLAVSGPSVLFAIFELQNPIAVLADSSSYSSSGPQNFWQHLVFNGATVEPIWLLGWFSALLLALATIAILGIKASRSALLAVGLILSLLTGYGLTLIRFPAQGAGDLAEQPFSQIDPIGFNALAVIILLVLISLQLESLPGQKAAFRAVSGILAVAAAAAAVLPTFFWKPDREWSEGRVAPSIVLAEAEQGLNLHSLIVTPTELGVDAQLVWGPGIQLEDLNTYYRIAPPQSEDADALASLVANLIAANDTDLLGGFQYFGIGYVILPTNETPEGLELSLALDSTKELEAIGKTDQGLLWRVREATSSKKFATDEDPWSLTRAIQVSVFAALILLAIPARGSTRRANRKSSEIFVAGNFTDEESN